MLELELIQVALGNRNCLSRVPSDKEWDGMYAFAQEQALVGVMWGGIERLPKEQTPYIDMMMEWLGQTEYLKTQSEQRRSVARKLGELWKAKGIEATVLKGMAIAQYYPQPELRYSCDLDVWIPDVVSSSCAPVGAQASKLGAKFQVSGWERACQLLEAEGVELEREVYKEVEFTLDDVYVECHRVITPVRGNKHLQKVEVYLRYLLNDDTRYFDDVPLKNPPLEFTLMLYIEHALGDLLHGKMTLRHVVDWMVIRKRMVPESSKFQVSAGFKARCKEFGFDRFLMMVDAIADVMEGRRSVGSLPEEYKEVFEKLKNPDVGSKQPESWFRRRIDVMVGIVKSEKMFRQFGYCSMWSFLLNAVWTHFFDKEIKY